MKISQHKIMMTVVIASVPLHACKDKDNNETSSSSQTNTGGSQSESGGSTSSSSSSTESHSTGASGGLCQGPEHQAFIDALCPYAYPDCTPNLPEMKWATYCQDAGIGPVGEGECGCTPKAVSCGTPNGDPQQVVCCCPLEDVNLVP